MASSVLNIELGGLAQGVGYDWISVLGTASLAGTLNVASYAGFVAPAGANFTIMNFASSSGGFAAVNVAAAVPPSSLSVLPTSVRLSVDAVAIPVAPTPVPPLPPGPPGPGPDPGIVAIVRALPPDPSGELPPLVRTKDAELEREIEMEGCR